jgi:cyclohexyl-isocyanide hydratase
MNEIRRSRREFATGAAWGAASLLGQTPPPAAETGRRRRVTILLFPGVTLLDAVGPYEMLHRVPNFEVTMAAETKGPQPVDSGLTAITAQKSIDEIDRTDLLLVPGGGTGVKQASENRKLMAWIQEMDRHTEYTASVCTGALILARAGLLTGRKATTHWGLKGMLQREKVEYVAERYVRAGKYWTSAGVSAGLDMSLALIAEMEGPLRAQIVQLRVEYDPHPPFRAGSERMAPPEVLAAARAGQ